MNISCGSVRSQPRAFEVTVSNCFVIGLECNQCWCQLTWIGNDVNYAQTSLTLSLFMSQMCERLTLVGFSPGSAATYVGQMNQYQHAASCHHWINCPTSVHCTTVVLPGPSRAGRTTAAHQSRSCDWSTYADPAGQNSSDRASPLDVAAVWDSLSGTGSYLVPSRSSCTGSRKNPPREHGRLHPYHLWAPHPFYALSVGF